MDMDPSFGVHGCERNSNTHKKQLFELARRAIFHDAVVSQAALSSGVSSVDLPGSQVAMAGRRIKASAFDNPWALYDLGIDDIDAVFFPRRMSEKGVLGETIVMGIVPLFTSPDADSDKIFKLRCEGDTVEVDYVVRKRGDQHVWSKANDANLQELDNILHAISSET